MFHLPSPNHVRKIFKILHFFIYHLHQTLYFLCFSFDPPPNHLHPARHLPSLLYILVFFYFSILGGRAFLSICFRWCLSMICQIFSATKSSYSHINNLMNVWLYFLIFDIAVSFYFPFLLKQKSAFAFVVFLCFSLFRHQII